MAIDFSAIKKPWVKYSVIGVVIVGVLLILLRRGGGSVQTVQSSGSDPGALAYATEQLRANTAAAAQTAQYSYGLSLDAQQAAEKRDETLISAQAYLTGQSNQINGALALQSLQTHASETQYAENVAGQIQLAQIQSGNVANQLAATTAIAQMEQAGMATVAGYQRDVSIANLATSQAIATTAANVAIHSSDNAASVASTQSNNSANVAINQSNNATTAAISTANTAANAANHASDNNLLGGLASLAFSLF